MDTALNDATDERVAAAFKLWEDILERRARAMLATYGGLNDAEQEDLLAEARDLMVEGMKNRTVAHHEAYGWTIVRNHLRKRAVRVREAKQRRIPLDEERARNTCELSDASAADARGEIARHVVGIASDLREEDRRLLIACVVKGVSVAEAARRIGVPRTTAGSRLGAAVRRIRSRLLERALTDAALRAAIYERWGPEALSALRSDRVRRSR